VSHPHIGPEEAAASARRLLDELLPQRATLKIVQRLKIPLQDMPTQPADQRRHNMQEVALGYSAEQAQAEAMRCIQCRNAPCIDGCPVRIDIPGFIKALADGDPRNAIARIKLNSLLPAVCGRVCPQESQCQEKCTVGRSLKSVDQAVAIGRLERYAADWERAAGLQVPAVKPETGRRVAIIGSGPASLTVAADVRREGHAVTIFEAFHVPGGVMIYGIPEFRLPKEIVHAEIRTLEAMGVEIRTDFVVGRTRRLRDLLEQDGYDALFIGAGAGLPKLLSIPGENLVGVYASNEFLTRVNLMKAYDRARAHTPVLVGRRMAVVGGGNVAMDAARTALRMGAEEVHVIYRRTEAEMPARREEIAHAREEGVQFHFLQNPVRILGDASGLVTAVECLRYELGAPDKSGRPRPVAVAGSEFQMPVEGVIIAVGNESNPLLRQTTPELKTNDWGNIVVGEDGQTSIPRVFAGGDIVLGAATVILAMGQGRRAAASINQLLAAPR
jgi:glutamate synthase (NADPH/NADH) small chain